jgi:hypothetical protein
LAKIELDSIQHKEILTEYENLKIEFDQLNLKCTEITKKIESNENSNKLVLSPQNTSINKEIKELENENQE